ncbi:MAG: single-stranded DNA-binding protein [Bifidobacterium scardovii]|uniref:single-stranded DNA-binding protein n=1 Tax=Bifidobacterium scardovii TaxID=158787 RepID=UPI0028FF99AA|nr:single-stranded DNA-binding protein [Bifidobacterium scardovii]MDU2421272.1 single-stranded DNA-binding protein [Bifidobacterium scardovii]
MAGETMLTIVGNLTADPELRSTGTGTPVANFTIASTPRTFNRQTGQYEDGPALFMRCSAWNDMAQHIAQTCSKGMRMIAQGRLSQRSYQAQDGTNRTVVEMTVDAIGPDLRYATASVTKQTGNGHAAGAYGNPNGAPPGGYQPPAPQQQSNAAQPPASDPWANGGGYTPAPSTTTDTGEPEF